MSEEPQFDKDTQHRIKILDARENIKNHYRRIKSEVKGINLDDQNDEKYYIQANEEIQSGTFNTGLMIKCEVSAEGDQSKAHSLYIKTRVKQFKEEERFEQEAADILLNAQSAKDPSLNNQTNNNVEYLILFIIALVFGILLLSITF